MQFSNPFNVFLGGSNITNPAEIRTYEPLFVDTNRWFNIIIGPHNSGKFTLTRQWLMTWKQKNRLCKLVIVSSMHAKRAEQFEDMNKFIAKPTEVDVDKIGNINTNYNVGNGCENIGNSETIIVNLNSPDWLNDLENIILKKTHIAPLETWAIVFDSCFWQSWVLKHRVIGILASMGPQLRIGTFYLFDKIPESMSEFLKSNIDSIVAFPHKASKSWLNRLENFTNGSFSIKKWNSCDHVKYDFWVCKMPTTTYVVQSKKYFEIHKRNDFDGVVPLQFRKKPSIVPYVSLQTDVQNSCDTKTTENKSSTIDNNKKIDTKEMVYVSTWWNTFLSWVPSIPSSGIF